MKTYTPEELAEVLEKHRLWLDDEEGGEQADLSGANLRDANLRGANLSELSSIWGLTGNLREVKAIQADIWPVTYTATHMQIGCQFHTLAEWWAFNDEEIGRMDSKALDWWAVWKPILKQIIDASPAVPGGEKPAENEAA